MGHHLSAPKDCATLLEVEQIMVSRDIDLERDREQLKGMRRGEWTLEQLETWAQDSTRSGSGQVVGGARRTPLAESGKLAA